jgi:hypothetical protein
MTVFKALMMEVVSTSEALVSFYKTTQCNNPEDSRLQSSCVFHLTYEYFLDH